MVDEATAAIILKGVSEKFIDIYPNEALIIFKEYFDKFLTRDVGDSVFKAFGDLTRIAVFGPYRDNKEIIDEICYYVCEKKYVVFTGRGYYHPSDPKKYLTMDDYLSEEAREFFSDPRNESLIYSHLLPGIVEKVICRVAPLRTQQDELQGAERYHKQVLGFVNDPSIIPVDQECDYVDTLQGPPSTIKRCSCIGIIKCSVNNKRKVPCIAYEPCEVTKMIKDMFLRNKERYQWGFFSLQDYHSIFPLIDEFLADALTVYS